MTAVSNFQSPGGARLARPAMASCRREVHDYAIAENSFAKMPKNGGRDVHSTRDLFARDGKQNRSPIPIVGHTQHCLRMSWKKTIR